VLDTVAFWVLGPLALLTGFAVFRVNSMARATYALLASFLCVGGLLLALGLPYLGALTVLMITVEMAVMAVFMIMYMMNPGGLMPMAMYHNKAGAMSIAVGTFVVLATGILTVDWPERGAARPPDTTFALGEALMGSKMLVMMVLGVALFATIVATVVLSTQRGRYDRYGDELERDVPDDPVPGGVGRRPAPRLAAEAPDVAPTGEAGDTPSGGPRSGGSR
jgi:NADH-quinone oxidoreductase subunit J